MMLLLNSFSNLQGAFALSRKMRKSQQIFFFKIITILCLSLSIFYSTVTTSAFAKTPNRFKVTNVTASASKDGIDTISNFKLSLSSMTYDAINQGIPIDIVLSYAIPKHRFWGIQYKELNKTIFKISRHSLSGNYVLKNISSFRNQQFQTIDDALREISLFQLKRLDQQSLKEIAVRIHLDLYALPPQIRAKTFFSGRWHHDSKWTIWPVSAS